MTYLNTHFLKTSTNASSVKPTLGARFSSTLKRTIKGAGMAMAVALLPALASASPMVVQLQGEFTIQQVSNGRYLDAHEGIKDNSVVTRDAQGNATQTWIFTPVGLETYTIQQKSSGRFLDAHEAGSDFSAVTRDAQGNKTQEWIVERQSDGSYVIVQHATYRFLDAHEGTNDNSAVTRGFQNNATQRWIIKAVETPTTGPIVPDLFGKFFIQQKSSGRFMDAHEAGSDFSAVTRDFQSNTTQVWVLKPLGNDTYTIQQLSTGRYLDAHEGSNDNSAVTRDAQRNATQQWILKRVSLGVYTIQQLSNGRYLDAHVETRDSSVVTRDFQGNTTQQWIIRRAN